MFHRAIAIAAAVLLAGCGLFFKKPPGAPEATLPTWIGRVVMVDEAHRFALVETSLPPKLEPDARLLAFRDRRVTADLVVTPEKRPPYLAVTIVRGMPGTGDTVALDESQSDGDLLSE